MTDARAALAATLAEEQAAMDELAPHYRHFVVTSSLLYDLERAAFADFVVSSLREDGIEPASARILDVGCGTGEILELLAARGGRRLAGLDLSPAMLREAKRHADTATLARGSIEEHPFRRASFDVVTASFAVHHLHDPAAFFAAARELIAPGGRIFVLDYNREGWWRSPRWRALAFRFAAAPVRFLVRMKNRRALAAQPHIHSRFNPSHRLHLPVELETAAREHGFTARSQTHGLLRLWFLTDVFATSRLDRALLRGLVAVEDAVAPEGAGGFLWLSCRAQTR